MEPENYISILCKFIGNLVYDHKLSFKDAIIILRTFEPVCEKIKSRQDLVGFIDKYVGYYWELKTLRNQLMDSQHKFN